jgi:hypothetical protein
MAPSAAFDGLEGGDSMFKRLAPAFAGQAQESDFRITR